MKPNDPPKHCGNHEDPKGGTAEFVEKIMRGFLELKKKSNQLNATMIQILTDIQRKINHGKSSQNQGNSGSSSRRHSHKRSHSSRRISRDRTYTHKSLLVIHLTLRNLVRSLHLIEIRGIILPRTTHMENLRRPNVLLLMVR